MDKFRIYKKWFWIGIAIAFLNSAAGLIYGIALAFEPEHKKEGWIIIGWSVLMFLLLYSLTRALMVRGLLPASPFVVPVGSESLPANPQ